MDKKEYEVYQNGLIEGVVLTVKKTGGTKREAIQILNTLDFDCLVLLPIITKHWEHYLKDD